MSSHHKLLSIAQAVEQVRQVQAAGQTVVMCHGCFDIVHPGHIRHLQHAAKVGDRLLVTITGDQLLQKGTGRPLIPQELRAENLAALDCVHWVAINHHPTAAELLEAIRPDVYVKGREYEHNKDPRFEVERQIVERHGGRVVFTSGDVVFSSTALINALEDSAAPFQSTLRQLIGQYAISAQRVDSTIASFHGKSVLVIGETIKDTYVMCERPAVAGESPIMTLRPVEHRSFDGGAAIIARHIVAMGGRSTVLTALPRSLEAESMRRRLLVEGVEMRAIEIDSPAMIEKQRFVVGASKVMKLDLGGPLTLDAALRRQFVQMCIEAARDCNAVIIADFGAGLFTPTMLTELCTKLRPIVPLLVGDVSGRRSNLLAMRHMDLICPSESEIRDALHEFDDGLSSIAWRVLDETKSAAAIATLGEEGLIAFNRTPDSELNRDEWQTRLRAQPVPALTSHAIDQLGCGDALLAAATLTLSATDSSSHDGLVLAAVIGSAAAASQAQRLGNAVISASDIRRVIRRITESQLAFQAEPNLSLSRPSRPLNVDRHDHLPAAHA